MWIKQPRNGHNVTGTVVMVLKNKDEPAIPSSDLANPTENSTEPSTENTIPNTGNAPQDNETSHEIPSEDQEGASGLKHTKGGIVLNPQPQDDPNDPLNWPMWRRDISLLSVSTFALLCGGQTPIMAPVMNVLGKQFDKPLHALTYFVGVFMASMGIGSAIFAPLAVKFGKRLIYLVSLLIFFAGLVWAANATSYASLMGARVLSGIGSSPAESLPSTTIAEIYFAHERAYRVGIYTLLLLGGKNLSPLASGFTANRLGWHWIYWVCAIICGAAFVAMFFFVHETWWERTPIPDKRSIQESEAARRVREQLRREASSISTGSGSGPNSGENAIVEQAEPKEDVAPNDRHVKMDSLEDSNEASQTSSHDETDKTNNSNFAPVVSTDSEKHHPGVPRRVPFFRNLAVYSGKKTNAKLWIIFLRPLMLYSYLPVLYATLVYGTSVVWLSVIAETINSIFTNEPYKFKSTSVGLLYIATFTGSVMGSMVAGKISDILVRIICRHNGGIYEPEFRLIMIAPVMVAVTIGLMGFGWSTYVHDLWIVPAIFLGLLGFGTSLASTVSITYVVDCYRKYALESLVSLNLAKNLMGLGFSIFVPYFFEASGSKTSFVVYGCVEIALCLCAIPLYHYGKVLRNFYDEKAWIEKLYR